MVRGVLKHRATRFGILFALLPCCLYAWIQRSQPPTPSELLALGIKTAQEPRDWPAWLPWQISKRLPHRYHIYRLSVDRKPTDPELAVIRAVPQVEVLELLNARLADEDVRLILASHRDLECLNLLGNNVTAELLPDLIALPNLEWLLIDCDTIGDFELADAAQDDTRGLLGPTIARRLARRFTNDIAEAPYSVDPDGSWEGHAFVHNGDRLLPTVDPEAVSEFRYARVSRDYYTGEYELMLRAEQLPERTTELRLQPIEIELLAALNRFEALGNLSIHLGR